MAALKEMNEMTGRFYSTTKNECAIIKDCENNLVEISSLEDALYMLNKLNDEIIQLKTYIADPNTTITYIGSTPK